jgi:hypothetical protein
MNRILKNSLKLAKILSTPGVNVHVMVFFVDSSTNVNNAMVFLFGGEEKGAEETIERLK